MTIVSLRCASVATSARTLRVVECDLFKPQFIAFKRCRQCSSVYEVFSNFNALDFELCPECNERMKKGAP